MEKVFREFCGADAENQLGVLRVIQKELQRHEQLYPSTLNAKLVRKCIEVYFAAAASYENSREGGAWGKPGVLPPQ